MRYLILLLTFLFACTNSTDTEGDDMKPALLKPPAGANRISAQWSVGKKLTTRAVGGSQKQFGFQTPELLTADYTISFNLLVPPNLTQAQAKIIAMADALIASSVDGVTTYRRISLVNGAQITVVAEQISVTVFDRSMQMVANGQDYEYDVSISVAQGSRSAVQQPPIFIPIPVAPTTGNGPGSGLLTPGQTDTWSFPDDCGAISLYLAFGQGIAGAVGDIPDGTIIVEQAYLRGSPGTAGTTLASYDPSVNKGWVPIVPGVNQIKITQNAASALAGIQYTLWIGISG